MKKLLVCAALVASSALGFLAYAQSSGCVKFTYSDTVCAPPGGTIIEERYSTTACGKGQCVKEGYSWACSSVPGGSAVVESYSVKCVGGCERPRADYCVKPE